MQILLMINRLIWALFAFLWMWNFYHGNIVRPFHPLNLILSIAVFTGSICVIINRPIPLIYAAGAGITYSIINSFQFLILLYAFSFSSDFRSALGPFQFEGVPAYFAVFFPLFLLATVSSIVLYSFARERKNDNTILE